MSAAADMRDWLDALAWQDRPQAGGDLRVDARRVRPGDVFVALAGGSRHGADFVGQAAAAGADAVISDRAISGSPLPVAVVPDLAAALWDVAVRRYPVDWSRVRTVAVTGTNGKTSVAHMLAYGAERLGWGAATIGTVAYRGPGHEEPARETTPHFVEVLRLLHTWQRSSPRLVLALEASSHALAQARLGGLPLDVAVLTNLTADHLDYHSDMAAYSDAKARLYAQPRGQGGAAAVLPTALLDHARAAVERGRTVWRFGPGGELDVRAVEAAATATRARLAVHGRDVDLDLAAAGGFQVDNAAAAILAFLALGVPADTAAAALSGWSAAPGRLERVVDEPFAGYVDYAHTPDALERTLNAARGLGAGRLIVVFGCGGERDRAKRPQMGAIAERLADEVVVTSDNPRGEEPGAILDEILAGMQAPERAHREPDRARAIAAAVALARPGDVVVIAGKGHETEQVFRDRTIDFNDRVELLKAVRP